MPSIFHDYDSESRSPADSGPDRRRALPRRRLIGCGFVLVVMITASACQSGRSDSTSGSSTAAGGASSQAPSALAFAQCMRAHGVANFPDPDAQGHLMLPQGIDPNSTQFQAASEACRSLMPDAGQGQVTSPSNLAGLAKYAKCMQEHGVPMSAGANGQLSFGDGFDPNSPQFQKASDACRKLVPAGLPGGAP